MPPIEPIVVAAEKLASAAKPVVDDIMVLFDQTGLAASKSLQVIDEANPLVLPQGQVRAFTAAEQEAITVGENSGHSFRRMVSNLAEEDLQKLPAFMKAKARPEEATELGYDALLNFPKAQISQPEIVASSAAKVTEFTMTPRGITKVVVPDTVPHTDRFKSLLAAQYANLIHSEKLAIGVERVETVGSQLNPGGPQTYRILRPLFPEERGEKAVQQFALDGSLAFLNKQPGNSYTKYLERYFGDMDHYQRLTKALLGDAKQSA